MKRTMNRRAATRGGPVMMVLAGLTLLATHALADAPLGLRPGSRLWLEGNSTLHAFTSTATVVNVSLAAAEVGSEIPWVSLVREGYVRSFDLTIPVRGLKSGKAGLDKKMYEALAAGAHPEIIFHLIRYDVTASTAPREGLPVKASGALTVAGVTREVEIEGRVEPATGGMILRGRKELLMTDFGVKPPTMWLGVVKTDNRVVIRFDLVLGPESDAGTGERSRP